MSLRRDFIKFPLAAAFGAAMPAAFAQAQPLTLLNVSYDPTHSSSTAAG